MKERHPLSRRNAVISAVVFVSLGVVAITLTRAAGTPLAFEVESGTVSAPAVVASSTGSSGGQYVKFGGPTPTPTPAPTPGATGTFTFASIPDTQRDMWSDANVNANFKGRLNWLVANKASINLKYVWQVGDLVDTDNLVFSSDPAVNPRYISSYNIDHWHYDRASKGLQIFETAAVPYALTVGNHDTGAVCGGPACPVVAGQTQATNIEVRNTSTWNQYFPPSRFPGLTTFEPGKTDNAYRIFTAGGLSWMVMNLELWPRTNVVNWAKTVVAAHPHENVIITTHSYLTGGGGIDQSNGGYGANTMQYVYDNLIKVYPNIKFTFSGHTGTSDYREDTGVNGNKIYNMTDCYHDTVNNWFRLLTVDTTNNTVSTKVYSPITNVYRTEATANVNITNVNWVR